MIDSNDYSFLLCSYSDDVHAVIIAIIIMMVRIVGWKPFEPKFIVRKRSDYRDVWTFRTMNQQQVLCEVGNVDTTRAYEEQVRELSTALMADNPLHMDDVFFAGIEMIIGIYTVNQRARDIYILYSYLSS